jgi:hypothetical protein
MLGGCSPGVVETNCDGGEYKELRLFLETMHKLSQKRKNPLTRCLSHFVTSDLRKFAEQHSDIVEGNKSNALMG